MVHHFRKHQQTLLIVVTILVLASFVYYWNGNQGGRGGGFSSGTTVATLNGQKISEVDVQRDMRKCQVAISLGLVDLVRGLAGNSDSEDQAMQNYVWNSRVLRHEADLLQIVPDDASVQQELMKVPAFQTNGQFDGTKLSLFVQDKLPSKGFTDTVIDDLLRDVVRMNRIKALIGSAVEISPSELKTRYVDENEKMDLEVVRLNTSDVEKNITISDADAKKAYDERKDQFKSDEQRKVQVAAFELTDAQKELKGKERTDALQQLANRAWDFTQAMLGQGANFSELAKKSGAFLSTSGNFTAAQPDPTFSKVPAIAPNAFQLTTQYPTSDVMEGQNGYYVIHLDGVVPSVPLSFDQAKTGIVEELRKQRATQIMQTTANAVRTKIQDGLKTGMPFADAAKGAGLTAEKIPPFSLAEAGKSDVPDNQQIVQGAVGLDKGQVSDFQETQAGGLFVYMAGREEIPAATLSMGEMISKSMYSRQKQEAAFSEWLRLSREAAHLQLAQQ